MKKRISCLLAAVLTCCSIPSGTWFETSAAEDNTPRIAAAEIFAQPGETVTVPLTVQHNPGIAALSISITYDAGMLTLLDAQSKPNWDTAVFLAGGDKTQTPYLLNWDSEASTDYTADGILAELRFAVAEGATGDAVIEVAVNQESTFHADFTESKFETQNGMIHIAAETTAPVTTTETTTSTTETTTSTTETTTSTAAATTAIETTAETTVTTTAEPAQAAFLRGDVDDNGTVDVTDAQLTLAAYARRIAGKPLGLTDLQFRAANVNLDEQLSVEDAQFILKYYARNTVAKNPTAWEELLQSNG
ncbi:MAG: hypothetical protein IKI45_16810 [Oscillospiraceae bacterium]|nr:hypothetical protein [Oscillospiraceae bacterium]